MTWRKARGRSPDRFKSLWIAPRGNLPAGFDANRVLRVFQSAERVQAPVYVPAIALWETGLLVRAGRVSTHVPFAQWTHSLLRAPGFDLALLDPDVIVEGAALLFHSDPFDAAIVATARVKGLPLITKDDAITRSGLVETIW